MFSISVLGRTKRSIQDGRSSKAPDARHGFMVRGRDLPPFLPFWPRASERIAQFFNEQKHHTLQGGPPTSYKWSYNPSYPFIRPFIGLITPLITGRGPPCVVCFLFNEKKNKTHRWRHIWGAYFFSIVS